jgi:hypothetical protein
MHVKYEDLCADTDRTLSKIFTFAKLPDKQLSPDQEKARRHTIAGNRTRFRDLEVIRHDEKWKDNLSHDQIAIIKKYSGPVSEALDYQ